MIGIGFFAAMKSPYLRDLLAFLFLLLLGGYYLDYREVYASLPYEDAAILMRYIDHLANGHGIVWNIGEAPIDGGTDFLFLLLAAGIQKLGVSTESAVLFVNLIGYYGTAMLVFLIWKKMGNKTWLSFLIASICMLGPGYAYVEAGFATPFFGFLASISSLFCLLCVKYPAQRNWAHAFGISALLLGFCRPEGVFLSAFLVLGVVIYAGKEKAGALIKSYLIWVVGVGSLYLIWHYLYFGHLFPNPFYKKGGGSLYWGSLIESLKNTSFLLHPWAITFFVLLLLGLGEKLKSIILLLVPLAGFSMIWVLLSNEMNYMMRFQYALFPVATVLMSYVIGNLPEAPFESLKAKILVTVSLFVAFVHYFGYFPSNGKIADGRYEIAKILQPYAKKGYSIALSEAGLLPFYSQWRCLDSWGLNDHQIALDGVIQGQYLREFNPDLIMYDAYEESMITNVNPIWAKYGDMIDTLDAYIAKEGFELVAKYPSPFGDHAHYYYLNPRIADAEAIKEEIRSTSYIWYENGQAVEAEF